MIRLREHVQRLDGVEGVAAVAEDGEIAGDAGEEELATELEIMRIEGEARRS